MIKRLAELIRQAEQECSEMKICSRCEQYGRGGDCQRLKISNHLLENGVIVSPCKVGDTVYVITEKHPCYACKWCGDWCHKDCAITDKTKLVVKEAKVFYFLFQEMHNKIQVEVGGTKHLQMHFLHFDVEDFGKTVFLTREEAEKALAERKENGK